LNGLEYADPSLMSSISLLGPLLLWCGVLSCSWLCVFGGSATQLLATGGTALSEHQTVAAALLTLDDDQLASTRPSWGDPSPRTREQARRGDFAPPKQLRWHEIWCGWKLARFNCPLAPAVLDVAVLLCVFFSGISALKWLGNSIRPARSPASSSPAACPAVRPVEDALASISRWSVRGGLECGGRIPHMALIF